MLCVVQASKALLSFVRALETSSQAKSVQKALPTNYVHASIERCTGCTPAAIIFALLLWHRLPVI